MTDAKFPEGRKLLALYPVLLFYLSLAWIVLIGFQQGNKPTITSPPTTAVSPPAAAAVPSASPSVLATNPNNTRLLHPLV